MEKLYISNWFKMPPKQKALAIKKSKRGAGRKYAESRKKIKK